MTLLSSLHRLGKEESSIMATRLREGGRGRRAGQEASNATGSAQALIQHVGRLVAENAALTAENARLKEIVSRVTQAVRGVRQETPTASRSSVAGNGRSRRGRRGRLRRAPVTDPAALERRRAALARAREVLAARRAGRQPAAEQPSG